MQELVEKLSVLLQTRGVRLLSAESCTGGLLAAAMTERPGSSDVFEGGVVSYSNELKQAFLHVSAESLEKHGAVSAEVAREMAAGLLRLHPQGLAVSITGIAGPGGSSAAKPVGLVYIGCGTAGRIKIRENRFSGTRAAVRAQAVEAALAMAIAHLEELP